MEGKQRVGDFGCIQKEGAGRGRKGGVWLIFIVLWLRTHCNYDTYLFLNTYHNCNRSNTLNVLDRIFWKFRYGFGEYLRDIQVGSLVLFFLFFWLFSKCGVIGGYSECTCVSAATATWSESTQNSKLSACAKKKFTQ